MKKLEVFFLNDQPVTCPKCGNRTKFTQNSKRQQLHICLFNGCKFKFLCEEDN